jgi:hypothetical protein
MTEAEARDLLANFDGLGLEAWMARRRWKVTPSGWTVAGELNGFFLGTEIVPAGLRITANMAGSRPAVWEVPAAAAPRRAR